MLEVELKAVLTEHQYLTAKQYLDAFFDYNGSVLESDDYFNGIDRDFSVTDEAFRIRKETKNNNTTTFVTYKGAKLRQQVKARTELEVSVSDYNTMLGIITSLGFKHVACVEKQRLYYTNGLITASLDTVKSLGSFIELEMLVSKPEDIDPCTINLYDLLDKLNIDKSALTNSSYLEMLLIKQKHDI